MGCLLHLDPPLSLLGCRPCPGLLVPYLISSALVPSSQVGPCLEATRPGLGIYRKAWHCETYVSMALRVAP